MTTFQLVLFQVNVKSGGSQGYSHQVVKRASKLNPASHVPHVPFFFSLLSCKTLMASFDVDAYFIDI